MPNWCYNTIEIEGPQTEIDKFEKHLDNTKGENWFSYFIPMPPELKEDGWYGWNIENYGVKWNCDASDWHRIDDRTIGFTFDSPWAPPIVLYENIEAMELESESGYIEYFKVKAEYLEEGQSFMGRFIDGEEEYYEYSDLESLDDIPEELVEHWGVRDRMLDDLWSDEEGSGEYSQEEVEQALKEIKAEYDKLVAEEEKKDK